MALKNDYASSPVLILHNVGNDSSGSKYEDLQDNPEITLVFNYTYKDSSYTVTIPGRDAKADVNIPWYGPVYLYTNY